MSVIKYDKEYLNALTSCTPNIKKFLERLNAGDSLIRWDRLNKDGCVQSDGSYFRVVSSVRTASEQVKVFKQGRKGVKSKTEVKLFPDKECSRTPATRYALESRGSIETPSDIATNAWAGDSFHNWGMAVDIVLRKFGEGVSGHDGEKFLNLSDGLMSMRNYYNLVGITALADSCGLEWGGNWTDFQDVAHFQDTAYQIPPKEYHWDKNMNADWLVRYYAGGGEVGSQGTATKGGVLSCLGDGLGSLGGLALGFVATLILFGEKKK